MKCSGTSHVERAIERLFRALQVPDADADLPERSEGDAEAMRRACLLL